MNTVDCDLLLSVHPLSRSKGQSWPFREAHGVNTGLLDDIPPGTT